MDAPDPERDTIADRRQRIADHRRMRVVDDRRSAPGGRRPCRGQTDRRPRARRSRARTGRPCRGRSATPADHADRTGCRPDRRPPSPSRPASRPGSCPRWRRRREHSGTSLTAANRPPGNPDVDAGDDVLAITTRQVKAKRARPARLRVDGAGADRRAERQRRRTAATAAVPAHVIARARRRVRDTSHLHAIVARPATRPRREHAAGRRRPARRPGWPTPPASPGLNDEPQRAWPAAAGCPQTVPSTGP